MHFKTKLLLQLLNLELRKEKKGAPRKEHFILLLLLLFAYFLNHSRPLGDQTSSFSGPGHFLVATGDRRPPSVSPAWTNHVILSLRL